MSSYSSFLHPSSRRGSALLSGLVLCIAIGAVVAAILRSSSSESRLNESHFMTLSARNAAESVVDYGVGQLVKRWESQVSFRDNELAPANAPLTLTEEIQTFLSDGGIVTSSLSLIGGAIPPNAQFYIDPEDPANRFDPQRGKIVLARDIHVYGRATATHPVLGERTAHAVQTLQLRDAPLFSHAVFYNMDLEFHPGAAMTMDGPVHANGNIWAVAKNDLHFTSVVTASGDFRIGMMRSRYQGDWSSMSGESDQSGKYVKIRDQNRVYRDPYRGSGAINKESSYYTSVSSDFSGTGYETWREFSSNKWHGNLQTRDHGVPTLNPIGYSDYVPDYTGSTEVANHAYAIIEPNLPATSPYHKGAGEEEKFARKAGLIIRIHRDEKAPFGKDDDRGTDIPAHAVRLRERPDADDGWTSYAREYYNYNREYVRKYDLGWRGTYAPPPVPRDYSSRYYISFATLDRTSHTEPNSPLDTNEVTKTVIDEDGNSVQRTFTEVVEIPVFMDPEFQHDEGPAYSSGNRYDFARSKISEGYELRAQFDEMFAVHPVVYEKDDNIDYNGDGDKNDLISGMIDKRIEMAGGTANKEASRLNVIEINLAAFARQVEDDLGDIFENYYMPHKYNGVVYVEFPTDNDHTPRTTDRVVRSVQNMALMLTQAGGSDPDRGRVPDPSYNIGEPNRDRGFTLATNSVLYVRGHFNADGNMSTPSGGHPFTESDNPGDTDPPTALAADAITILSPSWRMKNSVQTKPTASSVEISAAIVCGLVPTNKGGQTISSGGSHNFPRFLEEWSGKTVRYRGSMVSLFESEIQNQGWSTSYYGAPKREWGFFAEFARGNYPPGTPNVRSYRKVDFRYLSAGDFSTRLDALPWSVTLP